MRSIYGPGRILLASKKPYIQELIKRSEFLSREEIQKLQEKPDVIKGLLEIKDFGKAKGTNAELIATLMQKSHITKAETPNKIYKFTGQPIWLKTKSSEILIESGWHWCSIDKNKIYVSSNEIKLSSEQYQNLLDSSQFIKEGSMNDLRILEKDRVSKLL